MKNFMHSIRSLHYFNRQQKFLLKNFFPETKRYCLMPLTKKELINPNTKFDFQILLHNGFSWTIKNTELHNSKIKVLFLSLIIGDFSYLKYLSFLYINSSKLKKLHTRMNQETAFSKGRTVLCSNSGKFSEGPLKWGETQEYTRASHTNVCHRHLLHLTKTSPMCGCWAAARAYCCCWAAVNCWTVRALVLWKSY